MYVRHGICENYFKNVETNVVMFDLEYKTANTRLRKKINSKEKLKAFFSVFFSLVTLVTG